MTRLPQLREEMLRLPENERAELVRDLIRSLDGEADPEAAKKWADEIERRARTVLDGTAELVDGREALARVRARLVDRTK
jgi:putative addiction module component (TIGR02574 family)